jgi:hypothetical protein
MPASLSAPQPTQSIGQSRFAEAAANQQLMLNFLASLKDLIALFASAGVAGPIAVTPGAIAATTTNTTIASQAVLPAPALGDLVLVSYDQTLQPGLVLAGVVASAGNVQVTISNVTAGSLTPAAGNVRIVTLPKAQFFATLALLAGGLAPLVTA